MGVAAARASRSVGPYRRSARRRAGVPKRRPAGSLAVTAGLPVIVSTREPELSQRPQARAHLLHQELRLFPRREVPARVELVVMDEPGVRPLRPTSRRRDDIVRKNTDRN